MPDIATEPKRLSEVVIAEPEMRLSREKVVIASGVGVLPLGTVLAQITATKKYVRYAPAGADGSEVAKAVLITPVDATAADAAATVISALAGLADAGLDWGAVVDAGERADAWASLGSALIRPVTVN